MGKKTSLKDIANHIGVSTALVSYVMNGKEKEARVGKDMAAKIRKTALRLKYQPNLIAKGLKSGKTNTIGLIVADISNPFFSNIARIIEDEASLHGYTVIFGSSDENAGKSQILMDALVSRQVDGLIIAPASNTENQVKDLFKKKIPFVLIDRYFPKLKVPAIHTNNFEASYNAVSHLIKNGRKKIGMVAYQNELHHTKERERGYLQALSDAKIKTQKQWLVEVTFGNLEADMERLMKKMLQPKPVVDAVFFATNSLAVQGLKWIKHFDLKVPETIAIISFDQSDAFDFFYSPVTYVKQNILEMGRQAVNVLLDQIRNESRHVNDISIDTQLIIRDSSGVTKT